MDNLMMSLHKVLSSPIPVTLSPTSNTTTTSSSSLFLPSLLLSSPSPSPSYHTFQEEVGSGGNSSIFLTSIPSSAMDLPSFSSTNIPSSSYSSSSSNNSEMVFAHDLTANWTNEMKEELLSQLRRTMFALTSRAKAEIYIYSFLFFISVVGNLSAVTNLLKRENRRKRMNRLVIHLSLADLMVTFITIPFEVGWRLTVTWKAGVTGCKVFQFLRVFGLYLSSMVLVCISIDRYYAIVHPLRVNYVNQRNRRLLTTAWAVSIFFSIPEAVVYSVKEHPLIPDFHQCVSLYFFPQPWMEKGYNFFCLFGLYFGPLLVIVVCYSQILKTIFTQPVINDVLQTRNSGQKGVGRTTRWFLRIRKRRKEKKNEKKQRMARMVEENETELDVLKSRIHEGGEDSREWEGEGEHHDVMKTSEEDEEGEEEEERDDDSREKEKMLLHEVVQDGTCQAVIEPGMEEWKEVSTEERSVTSVNNAEEVTMMSRSSVNNAEEVTMMSRSSVNNAEESSLNNPEEVTMMSQSVGLKLAENCNRNNGTKRKKDEGRSCNNTIINDDCCSSATPSNCITSHPVSHSASHPVTPSIHSKFHPESHLVTPSIHSKFHPESHLVTPSIHSKFHPESHPVTPSIHSKFAPSSASVSGGVKSTRTVSSYVSLSNKIRRAKRRTVRMSITIIAAFLICWTPYVIVVFWYQIDEESAKRFDQYTKDGLFTFAVANSCLNPIVYGSHLIKSACQRSTNRLAGNRTTGGIERTVPSRFTKRSIIIDSTGNTV